MAVSEDSFSSLSRGFIKGVFEISCFRKQTQKEFRIWTLFSSLFFFVSLGFEERGKKDVYFTSSSLCKYLIDFTHSVCL